MGNSSWDSVAQTGDNQPGFLTNVGISSTSTDISGHVALNSTSKVPLIPAQGSGNYADLASLEITNASASSTVLTISDGTENYVYNLSGTGGVVSNLTRSRRATSSNTAWTAQLVSAATVDVNFIAILRR
jgi:hypothetical protein